MNDLDVRTAFSRLEDSRWEPPLGVDAHAALAAGRQLARRRRLGRVGVAGLAAVAVAAGGVVVYRGLAVDRRPAVLTGAPAGLAPTEFDPLVALARMPDVAGLPDQRVELSRTDQLYSLTGPDGATGLTGMALTLYAAGHAPDKIEVGQTPAPAVQGHPAWWWCPAGPPAPNRACQTLTWQWAPGGWAVLRTLPPWSTPADAVRRTAQRVAGEVTMVRSPMSFAFSLAGLPRGARITSSGWFRRHGVWTSTVGFSDGTPTTATDHPPMAVTVVRDPQNQSEPPNTTVDGRQARLRITGDSGSLTVPLPASTTVYVLAEGLLGRVGGADGLRALYRSVRLVARPDDYSTWTTRPVR